MIPVNRPGCYCADRQVLRALRHSTVEEVTLRCETLSGRGAVERGLGAGEKWAAREVGDRAAKSSVGALRLDKTQQ